MGMFDIIVSEYPLTVNMQNFQTKDLDCTLAEYKIDKDGNLFLTCFDGSPDIKQDFTGTINFYQSTISASGPGLYTSNGEDYESVEYEANFLEGKLTYIEMVEWKIGPALKSSQMSHYRSSIQPKTYKEKDKVYVMWGGSESGKYCTVLAADDDPRGKYCMKYDKPDQLSKGMFLIHKGSEGNLIFDSEEQALQERDNRTNNWKMQEKAYEDYCEEWHKNIKIGHLVTVISNEQPRLHEKIGKVIAIDKDNNLAAIEVWTADGEMADTYTLKLDEISRNIDQLKK
jgi:hypothetical protein